MNALTKDPTPISRSGASPVSVMFHHRKHQSISRLGASPGCVKSRQVIHRSPQEIPNNNAALDEKGAEVLVTIRACSISRLGASPGCGTATEPGLAPKRLICSWTVDVKEIDSTTFDLSVKNPNTGEAVAQRSPQAILDEIAALDAESAEVLATIRGLR